MMRRVGQVWTAARAALRRRPGIGCFLAGAVTAAALTATVGALLPDLGPSPAGEPDHTLLILSGTDDSAGRQRHELIEQWNTAGRGRWPRAEIIPVAGGANAAHSEMVARAQGNGQPVDIYNLDVTSMAEFVEFDYLRPLDEEQVDLAGFLEKPLETCRRDGRLWALPFNTDAGLLYYRSDLLAGEPPTSWRGVVRHVNRILADPDPTVALPDAGWTGQLDEYEGLLVNAFEAIWEAGGDVVDADDNVVIDSQGAREGLIQLARGLQPGDPQLILPKSLDYKESESTDAFREGQVVFMRNWPVAYSSLAGGESGTPAVPFQVSRLPGRSVLGGQNLAIAASSDQPRAAQALIQFLTDARSQQILFERGGFASTREIVYHDKRVREAYPYAETLLDAIKQSDTRPNTPHYGLFSKVFVRGVRRALADGGELPEGFAEELTDALRGVRRR
jgi:multiple sugar transport system substrate-binding protein